MKYNVANYEKKQMIYTIVLYKNGCFYNAYNQDAYIINYIFYYKLFSNSRGYCRVGFPTYMLDTILDTLDEYEINYNVIDGNVIKESRLFSINNYTKYTHKCKCISSGTQNNSQNNAKNNFYDNNCITVGCKVTFFDETYEEENELTIISGTYKIRYLACGGAYEDANTKIELVGSADPDQGTINEKSPIAKALIGHREGETVSAKLPNGLVTKLKIISVIH